MKRLSTLGRVFGRMPGHGPAYVLSAVAAVVVLSMIMATPSEARSRHAEMVVDGESGRVLVARNADARKYPASLTKIMTLYMVFEALENGKLHLDQTLITSRRASGQPASKLGLRQGEPITVRQAILALVTKSANDVATIVAEAIGGTEFKFALKMTRRARDLGMSKTTFRNASGLPNRRQLSTARDMARLALAIRRDFPQHFEYFSLKSFAYRGKVYRNHNNLIGSLQGVDGIKTGYIRASGFNLVATASRAEGRLVGVLFGGRSAKSRDARMRSLLSNGFARLQSDVDEGLPSQFVRPRGRMDGFSHVPVPRQKPRPTSQRTAAKTLIDVLPNDNANRHGTPASGLEVELGLAWSVQIGAFSRVGSVRSRLHKLSGALPDLMSQARVSIVTVENSSMKDGGENTYAKNVPANNGAIQYRARLHGMSEFQAHELCRRIKSVNFDCLIIAPTEASLPAVVNRG